MYVDHHLKSDLQGVGHHEVMDDLLHSKPIHDQHQVGTIVAGGRRDRVEKGRPAPPGTHPPGRCNALVSHPTLS